MVTEGPGDETAEYGLLMPFVVCKSKGGPYDDDAYVAGYEMGMLDHVLCHSPRSLTIRQLIHTANQAQADLIAMRHDRLLRVVHTYDGESGDWLDVEFVNG